VVTGDTMYNGFYRFKQEPFRVTPDPDFFFLSSSHREALAALIYGIEKRKGFIAVVGEVGVGKTTVLRSYLENTDHDNLTTVYVFNANVSFQQLLKTIFRELAIESAGDELAESVRTFHEYLIDQYEKGRNVALLIDEAQNMPTETLENLRMLSNLETSTDKLLQMVLIGQPELQAKLDQHELRQLKQRIAIFHRIMPLNRDESLLYINHRLNRVALGREPIFTQKALKGIIKYSGGIPRVINILCDNALIAGFGYQKKPIDYKMVREIIADLNGRKKSSLLRQCVVAAAVFLLVIVAALGFQKSHRLQAFLKNTHDYLQGNEKKAGSTYKRPIIEKKSPQSKAETGKSAPLPENKRDIATPSDLETTSKEGLPAIDDPKIPEDKPRSANVEYARRSGTSGDASRALNASNIGSDPATDEGLSVPSAVFVIFPDRLQKDRLVAAGEVRDDKVKSIEPINEPSSATAAASTAPSLESGSARETNRTIRIVQKGDSLTQLVAEVYGSADNTLIELVRKNNPWIQDINRILVGAEILFPETPGPNKP